MSDNAGDRDGVYAKYDANHSQASTICSSPSSFFHCLRQCDLTEASNMTLSRPQASQYPWHYMHQTQLKCVIMEGTNKVDCSARPSFTQLTHIDQISQRSTDTDSNGILTRPRVLGLNQRNLCFPHGSQCGSFYTSSLYSVNENRQTSHMILVSSLFFFFHMLLKACCHYINLFSFGLSGGQWMWSIFTLKQST